MTRLAVPAGVDWELVVVNNRCTDATDEVIASFAGRLPIRRAWEPRPGLSNARNRGVAESRGEYIIWTDDDVLVDASWLAAYHAAFQKWPDADVFGGPIEPLFEGEPPPWLLAAMNRIGHVFGRQTLGDAPVRLSPDVVGAGPYGGNMAMRREVLLRFPFNSSLGVRHGEYSIGEETEVIRHILTAGMQGWWTPEPQVRHWVPSSSQNLRYVRRWMIGCGKCQSPDGDPSTGSREQRTLRLYARLLRYELKFRLQRLFYPPEVWIHNLVRASQMRGRILARRQADQEVTRI
jgi:glucosyl-dolichyl phosphate glucuronosyltransferase